MSNAEEKMEEYYKRIAPKEFSEVENNMVNRIIEILGPCGRMISGSKSSYKGNAVFNANLCIESRKLWFGDIDLDKDKKKLQAIADCFAEPIYILREMDARFDTENSPKLENAKAIFKPSF